MAQDSSKPEFWDTRYRQGVTPWDAGHVPAELRQYAHQGAQRARILIPGCGAAYEARFLSERGFDVLAIDFSPAAIDAARVVLGPFQGCLRLADFFGFEEDTLPFDAIYERALLCALPRVLWQQWAARMAQLVRPEGLLFGYFFFDRNLKGPPFGIEREQLDGLLASDFECIEEHEAGNSIPVFTGKERWMLWKRLSRERRPV